MKPYVYWDIQGIVINEQIDPKNVAWVSDMHTFFNSLCRKLGISSTSFY